MGVKIKIFIICFAVLGADFCFATRLIYPDNVEVKELNKEETAKFQTLSDEDENSQIQQYKGPLKFTEMEPEPHLDEYAMYISFSANVNYVPSIKLEDSSPNTIPYSDNGTTHYQTSYDWILSKSITDNKFSYSAGIGLYWINGVMIELEYSDMNIEITDFLKGADIIEYGENTKDDYGYWDFKTTGSMVLNEFMQTSAVLTKEENTYQIGVDSAGAPVTQTDTYFKISGNTIPILQLRAKNYFVNMILEQAYVKSKIRPYLGFGVGFTDITIANLAGASKPDRVMSGQVMIGFSYPISENKLNLYFGYKGVFMPTIKKKLTKIYGVECPEYNVWNASLNGGQGGVESDPQALNCGPEGGSGYGITPNGDIYVSKHTYTDDEGEEIEVPDIEEREHNFNFSYHSFSITTKFLF
ncbi:MAG: hypothetical protein Ta2D_05640 [Rickettsiales bacterium]|nr:MAG: hypothetical protein Ta2D_05640 [Rickettsiales bacterium]